MKLSAEPRRGQNLVTGYAPGEVRVAERTLRSSAIVTPEAIVDWPVKGVAALDEAALDALLRLAPELVVLGTGEQQQFPAGGWTARLLGRGVGCEVMQTGAACRTYNVLVAEDRRAVLALIFA